MTAFETRWREMPVHPESPAFQRVDASHPLNFYLGRDVSGEWVLLLVTEEQPKSSREYQAIHVISRQRGDGQWALLFRLMQVELEKLFALLCEDLVESSRSIQDSSKAASFVLARFARWQKLMERGHSGLLDEPAMRGLIGELLFLEHQAIPSKGLREAVNGWVGPTGAERDFRFPEQEFEVKTVHTGAHRVLISSAEQLDIVDKGLDLFVVFLDSAEPDTHHEAFTPLEIVSRLRDLIESDSTALELFEARLMEVGFVTREEYGERAYIFRQFRAFHVTEGFPSIRRSHLPAGIGKVVWELDLASILPYEFNPSLS